MHTEEEKVIFKKIAKMLREGDHDIIDSISALTTVICSSCVVYGLDEKQFSDMIDLIKQDFKEMKELNEKRVKK